MISWYVLVNFKIAFCSTRWALVVCGWMMTQHPFPAFSHSGAGIKHVGNKLYCKVDDGNRGGHQCWDAACGIQRSIGIHDTV